MNLKGVALQTQIDLHKQLINYGILPSCINCQYTDRARPRIMATIQPGDEAPVFCEKYMMTPPLQVVVAGCPAWEDGIPF